MDSVDQTGDEKVGARVRFGEEATDEMRSPMTFEVASREREGIKIRTVLFATREESFAIKTIERGHHRGVSQVGVEMCGDLLHGGAAELAEDGEYLALATAEQADGRGGFGVRASRIFGDSHA